MNRNERAAHYSRPRFTAPEQLQGLGHIIPAYPQGIWISTIMGKLGCHVGLPDGCVFAAGAKAHCGGGL